MNHTSLNKACFGEAAFSEAAQGCWARSPAQPSGPACTTQAPLLDLTFNFLFIYVLHNITVILRKYQRRELSSAHPDYDYRNMSVGKFSSQHQAIEGQFLSPVLSLAKPRGTFPLVKVETEVVKFCLADRRKAENWRCFSRPLTDWT